MSSKTIDYDAVVGPGAGQYYGQIILSNIRYEDGSAVIVQKFLAMSFLSPARVSEADINVLTNPWVEVDSDVANEKIDTVTFSVNAKLNMGTPVSMGNGGTITIGINGDLTVDPQRYLESFVLSTDSTPDTSGTVNISCAASPDPLLDDYQQTVTFTMGERVVSVNVPLGETTPCKIPAGTYAVTADQLATEAQTVVVDARVDPSSLTVKSGETVGVDVRYGRVTKYGAINVTIGNIWSLETERFHVRVVDSERTLAEFWSPNHHTTELRQLPSSGTVDISIDSITLNNLEYSFDTKSRDLSPSLIRASFREGDLNINPVDTTGFVILPTVVQSDVSLDSSIIVRLTSSSSPLVYTQKVIAAAGTSDFAFPVAPGNYTVQVVNFIENGIVYNVTAPRNLTVAANGSTVLDLILQRGANLMVKGFPGFLSFGGCTDFVPGNEADFVAARASSIFKYAGVDGAGDAGVFLADDQATRRTIALARDVETQLGDGNQVLPVMISYTCNMSGGNPKDQLRNVDGLAHSFANLILSLNIANAAIDHQHPVPAGYVVNPDFLGACQQEQLSPGYEVNVREPLKTALQHWDVDAEIPAYITDTLRGYVLAVNWLIRTVAPACTFGWQVNLWGVGSSTWVYGDEDVAVIARQTGDYAKSLGVFDNENLPDFLAVDRYEADDFTIRSYGNGYCYGPREWGRFFDFCGELSAQLQFPIMPWQIPSSWTPLTTDAVEDDFNPQHWGTGGSYILGDAGINSDYHNVNAKILALQFSPALPYMGKTAEDIFLRAEPFDLTVPKYIDFPLRGMFAVLLGGGSTTGIVASIGNPQPWARAKLYAYSLNRIHFNKE